MFSVYLGAQLDNPHARVFVVGEFCSVQKKVIFQISTHTHTNFSFCQYGNP